MRREMPTRPAPGERARSDTEWATACLSARPTPTARRAAHNPQVAGSTPAPAAHNPPSLVLGPPPGGPRSFGNTDRRYQREEVKIMLHLLEAIPVLGPVVGAVLAVEHGVVEVVLVVVTIARAVLGL
jgi:hypothetical protein